MIEISSQPLGKNYVAHVLSRSFLISYFCYILVLIITGALLININYSWPQYKRVMVNPTLSYQSYQISCLDNTGNIIYNSNFLEGVATKDYGAIVSVGIQQKKMIIEGQVAYKYLKACSLQLYFNTYLGPSIQVLTHLPLNFEATKNQLYLSQWHIKGTISAKSSAPLPQSSVISINQTQFGTYPYSYIGNFRESASKTVHLTPQILYNAPNYVNINTSVVFNFKAQYQILGSIYLQQASLVQKLRSFIPIFMYISVLLWFVVINPLIDWMLRNKVYSAKSIPQKIKKD